MAEFDRTAHLQDLFFCQGESDHNYFHRRLEAQGRCCINQGRGEAVLTFTRNDMAVTL